MFVACSFLLSILYKPKVSKQKASANHPVMKPLAREVGRGFTTLSTWAARPLLALQHISPDLQLRHHKILWMLLMAEKTWRLLFNNWVLEPPKVGWSWDGNKNNIYTCTHIYREKSFLLTQGSEGLCIEYKQLVWCDAEVGTNRRIQRPDWRSSVESVAFQEQKSRDSLWGFVLV